MKVLLRIIVASALVAAAPASAQNHADADKPSSWLIRGAFSGRVDIHSGGVTGTADVKDWVRLRYRWRPEGETVEVRAFASIVNYKSKVANAAPPPPPCLASRHFPRIDYEHFTLSRVGNGPKRMLALTGTRTFARPYCTASGEVITAERQSRFERVFIPHPLLLDLAETERAGDGFKDFRLSPDGKAVAETQGWTFTYERLNE